LSAALSGGPAMRPMARQMGAILGADQRRAGPSGNRACSALAAIALVIASIVGCDAAITPAPTPEDWLTLPAAVNVAPLLWLPADSLSGAPGSPVASWPANAGPDAAQSNRARQPTLAELRGRAAVHFDGVDDVLESGLNISPSAHPELTIVALFSSDVDAMTPLRKLYGADDGGYDRAVGLDDRAANGRNYTVFGGDPLGDVGYFDLSAGQEYLTVDLFGVDTFNGWVNGDHVVRDLATDHGDGLPTFFIGGTGTVFSEPWKGTVAELLVFDGVLSDSQREALEDFLGRKYAFVIDRP
jgi:hypothetical protein